jgi:hypothetical protein
MIDNENALLRIWMPTLWGTLIVFLAVRWRRWTAAFVLPVGILFPLSMLLETYGPAGDAILREVGVSYVLQAHLGCAAVLAALVLGWRAGSRRAERRLTSECS